MSIIILLPTIALGELRGHDNGKHGAMAGFAAQSISATALWDTLTFTMTEEGCVDDSHRELTQRATLWLCWRA